MADGSGSNDRIVEAISSVQKEQAKVSVLVDRLDITIDKLTEVTTSVSQLLAVQGNRLEFQEKVADKLQQQLIDSIKDLHNRIDQVQDKGNKDLDSQHTTLLAAINSSRANNKEQFQKIQSKIARIEKWQWMIIGGAFVLEILLSKLNLANLF